MERDPDIPFTYKYSQPEEYHFSVDSIEMAWKVANYLKVERADELKNRPWSCLDLCGGCGVIGFEMNFHIPELKHWDFVEVQNQYREHFDKNKTMVLERIAQTPKRPKLSIVGGSSAGASQSPEEKFQLLEMNYEKMIGAPEFAEKYQLIMCNPPYFMPDQGKLSPSEFKNRCRFFLDSSFEKLIESIHDSLAMDGEAFLLVRDLEDHQIDLLSELKRLTRGRLKVENLDLVRGTFLLKLYR